MDVPKNYRTSSRYSRAKAIPETKTGHAESLSHWHGMAWHGMAWHGALSAIDFLVGGLNL